VQLVLASASPRRAELLTAAGFLFETVAVDIDEQARAGEDPAQYVERLAREKSARGLAVFVERQARDPDPAKAADRAGWSGGSSLSRARADIVVLGADTTVVVRGAILGKPSSTADAARMLRELSGRAHRVMTGVSLRPNSGPEVAEVVTTAVEFATLTADDIDWYVRTGEGVDKAGAYAIQGLASRFVARIDGSYANVVGLPVATVFALARRSGWALVDAAVCR
jgi:septum formation protein